PDTHTQLTLPSILSPRPAKRLPLTPFFSSFYLNHTPPTEIYTLSLHDALPIFGANRKPSAIQQSILQPSTAMQPINRPLRIVMRDGRMIEGRRLNEDTATVQLIDKQERLISLRSEEHTSELQSQSNLVCRLLLE